MKRPPQLPAMAVLAAIIIFGSPAHSAPADDAITITPADFRVAREKILEQAARLEAASSPTVSTADYARNYQQLQKDVARAQPPLNEWTTDEQERIKNLPEPAEAAWQALNAEKTRTQERIDRQISDAEQAHQELLEQQRINARRQAETERARRDAELKEAQIRESLARTEYYEDSNRYYPFYGSNWWWSHPVKPRPTPHGENRYYGTKPPQINDYKGRPLP